MANIKSAKKRAVRSEKRRCINSARRNTIKTAVKSLSTAIANGETEVKVKELFRGIEAQMARAKRKILHPNAAARKVSRLAKRVANYCRSVAA